MCKLNFYGSIIGHLARMEEGRNAFKILKGKPTGKRPFGRPKIGLILLRIGIVGEPL
jgi:hypothetical protein